MDFHVPCPVLEKEPSSPPCHLQEQVQGQEKGQEEGSTVEEDPMYVPTNNAIPKKRIISHPIVRLDKI